MVERKRQQLRAGMPLAFALALILALGMAAADSAAALTPTNGAEIKEFVAFPSTADAGTHPDITVRFKVSTRISSLTPGGCNCNDIKNAKVELPAGFIGNPHATPQCTTAQFSFDKCPIDSQVGVAVPAIEIADCNCESEAPTPLYNLVPQPGQAGLLAFKAGIFDFPIYTVISARTGGDYGLDAEVTGNRPVLHPRRISASPVGSAGVAHPRR